LCKVFDLGGLSPDFGFENEEKSCFMELKIGKVFEDNGLGLLKRGPVGGFCALERLAEG
jgi:hypothetical protein